MMNCIHARSWNCHTWMGTLNLVEYLWFRACQGVIIKAKWSNLIRNKILWVFWFIFRFENLCQRKRPITLEREVRKHVLVTKLWIPHLIFYLQFGCPTSNFRSLSRGQYQLLHFVFATWKSAIALQQIGYFNLSKLFVECEVGIFQFIGIVLSC